MTLFSRIANWFSNHKPSQPSAVVSHADGKEATFVDYLVRQARSDCAKGVFESKGKNQGPEILKYWSATSLPEGHAKGYAWCAASMAYDLLRAVESFYGSEAKCPWKRCRSARVIDWPVWALRDVNRSYWSVINPTSKVKRGDIICFDFNGRDEEGGTHIGLAVTDEYSDGKFWTVEGNTNSAGSREGDGKYEKSRTRKGVWVIIRFNNY